MSVPENRPDKAPGITRATSLIRLNSDLALQVSFVIFVLALWEFFANSLAQSFGQVGLPQFLALSCNGSDREHWGQTLS